MSKVPKAISDYMSALGARGGATTGAAKARNPEHYKKMADIRRAKAKGIKRAKG